MSNTKNTIKITSFCLAVVDLLSTLLCCLLLQLTPTTLIHGETRISSFLSSDISWESPKSFLSSCPVTSPPSSASAFRSAPVCT